MVTTFNTALEGAETDHEVSNFHQFQKEGAHGGGLVEVAGEGDFVADLRFGWVDPGVSGVGQHFAAEERFDPVRVVACGFGEWYLLGVA